MVLSLTTLELKRAVFRNPTSLTSGQFKSWHLGHGKYTLHYTCYVCVNQTVSVWGDAAAKLVDQEREREREEGGSRCCVLVTRPQSSYSPQPVMACLMLAIIRFGS